MGKKLKYDASNIKVLTGLDAVRTRAGMYIGDTENPSSLILVILDEFKRLIENKNGKPYSSISIVIHKNNEVELTFNESCLSIENIDSRPELGKLMAEFCSYYRNGSGISGLMIVNALSSTLDITIEINGIKWIQKYQNGKQMPLKKVGKVDSSSTTIRFLPDKKYFKSLYFDQTYLRRRFKELSFLNSELWIDFEDRSIRKASFLNSELWIDFEDRSIRKASFHHPNGLADLVLELLPESNNWKTKVPPLQIIDNTPDFKLEAVIVFSEDYSRDVSFVNDHETIEGGAHQKGLIAGIAQVLKVVSGYKRSAAILKPILQNGLVSVLSVQISEPKWADSTRDKLISKSVYTKTKSMVAKNLLKLMNGSDNLQYEFKKLYIDKYLMTDYQKNHNKYGLPTPKYVEDILVRRFNNPKEYDYLVNQYIEFERLTKECLMH